MIKGVGIGLRTPHFSQVLSGRSDIGWVEVISENFMETEMGEGLKPARILEAAREHYPISLHGVSLSLGSTDPLNLSYLKRLKHLIQRVQPDLVSDHLCWTGVGGENLHDLLPLPYTEEAIVHLVKRIQTVQEILDRKILIENVSSYLSFTHSCLTEWDFLNTVAKQAGCGILLDINNIYVSAFNHSFNPNDYLKAIDTDLVEEFHLAGYSDCGTHLIDTHDHPVYSPVWDLYERSLTRFGKLPTLIEWDANIPDLDVLLAESAKAKALQEKNVVTPQSKATAVLA